MKRLLLAVVLTLVAATSATAQVVVLVRHAEKADQSADPLLSEAGQVRAAALREEAEFDFDEILVTPLQRTQLTAAPSAAASHVTPTVIPLDGGLAGHVEAIVARVRALPPTAKVLVVGHSNTIPVIVRALGGTSADMPDCEYDRLTIVILGDNATAVSSQRHYGAPSTCD